MRLSKKEINLRLRKLQVYSDFRLWFKLFTNHKRVKGNAILR